MDLSYVYMLKRGEMGKQPLFSEQGPVLCDSVAPRPLDQHQFVLRAPVHAAVQHAPRYSHHTVNTERAEYTNAGANHAEGGWPRDVNVVDPEATQRYRRKVEKDDGYIRCVTGLSPGLEHYVLQNNAIDMYRTYYSELQSAPCLEQSDIRTVNVFRDDASLKRPVSSICWEPDDGERFTTTYVSVDFDRNTLASLDASVWNVNNANAPELKLSAPSPLLDLQYNPRHVQVLAGGTMAGGVCGFDRRTGTMPAWQSPPHVAHRDLVRNVLFVNAKSGMELFSAGADGVLKWWDLRNMAAPIEELMLYLMRFANDEPTITYSNGASVLEFEHTIPTRFMVGTENGLVLAGNRKGKTLQEKLPGKFVAHLGPVWALQRNPGFLKNFLTVGDWTARVWSEDCRESAVLWTPPQRHRVADGVWSPTRVSLMLLAQYGGRLAVWDLLRRQHEPALTKQVCNEPLLRVRVQEKGKLVTCGSRNGNVYLLELSANLMGSEKNDKSLMNAVLERESKRERILEARLREIRLRLRQAEERSPAASLSELDAALGDKDLNDATADFMAIVRKEFAAL